MNLKLAVDVDGLERKFELLTDSVGDLAPALKTFDQYLALRVKRRFDQGGPGWPPLSREQAVRRAAAARSGLERKLGRDVWRAADKLEAVREVASGVPEDPKAARRKRTAAAALQRRVATLMEYRRLRAGGAGESEFRAKAGFSEKQAARQSASLSARAARAERRASRQLGRIADSFKSSIRGGVLTRESEISWAGVHNEGGTVGRGAEVPARPFLFIEDEDLDVLVETLRNRMLLALEG